MSIYGSYAPYLSEILNDLTQHIQIANQDMKEKTGFKLYEHFTARVKSEDSMLEKLSRKSYEIDTYSALKRVNFSSIV